MLDGNGFYIGSQNMYPGDIVSDLLVSPPESDDFGYFVDTTRLANHDLSDAVIKRVVGPWWKHTAPRASGSCGALPHWMQLAGSASTATGTLSCTAAFIATLDFLHVAHDQIAKVSGATVCTSTAGSVNVTIAGAIDTQGRFNGTIGGTVGPLVDTVALTGTFAAGRLSLSFSGLEPVAGVPYSGTMVTLQP